MRKLRHKYLGLLLSSLLFIMLVFPWPTHAQGLAFSLSPPLLELMIKPGKSITQVYKFLNDGEDAVVIPKLLPLGENGALNDKAYVPENWINILPNNALPAEKQIEFNKPFFIKRGEERQIVLRINPPEHSPEQDYYRILLFSTEPNLPSETSHTALSAGIGSILLINVTQTGLVPRGAQITKFALPKFIDSFDPLAISIQVKNTGKTFFRPQGNVYLQSPIGKGQYAITDDLFMAGQTKYLATENKNLTDPPTTTLSLPGFYIGKYIVGVIFSLGESNIKVEQNQVVYAFPWKISLILLTGTVLVRKILKKRSNKNPKKK